ncbi:MAG: hypothetical protein H6R17_478 [Proteobacteria bacterium]|nr:hypothetical protein [Pseudomonadota bacterium]
MSEANCAGCDDSGENASIQDTTPQPGENVTKQLTREICSNCVKDAFLSSAIITRSRGNGCFYCNELAYCFPIENLATLVDRVLAQQFVNVWPYPPAEWLDTLHDTDCPKPRTAFEVIQSLAPFHASVTSDITDILKRRYADPTCHIEGKRGDFDDDVKFVPAFITQGQWPQTWTKFEHALKYEARYFSQTNIDFLHEMFDGIDRHFTINGKPVVTKGGPRTRYKSLYRARVFQDFLKMNEALADPEINLGPPPHGIGQAGRMNANGISVFYGALQQRTALSEVRPPVGSYVVTARFDIIEPIRLLNLSALEKAVSNTDEVSRFNPSYEKYHSRILFLRSLRELMTRPVMPDDELTSYLPTQVIADYLSSRGEPQIHGIVFPSTQVAGKASNVVLFHKAARIATPSLTDIHSEGNFSRTVTLKLNRDSISIKKITANAVKFDDVSSLASILQNRTKF